MLKDIQAVILAGGKSKRFNTEKPKLVEKICGQELVIYPLRLLEKLSIPTTVVIGHHKEAIKQTIEAHCKNITFCEQTQQLGTGNALAASRNYWQKEYVLIMKGDVPLITTSMIEELYATHISKQATISFMMAHNDNPTGYSYSRVIKKDGIITIKRPKALSHDELHEHCYINGGVMLLNRSFLQIAIDKLQPNEYTNEYHMSDLINVATDLGEKVITCNVPFDYVRGINNYQELWAAEQIKRSELIRNWMDRGVRFSSAQSVHIDLDVEIGAGTFVGCGVHLLSGTKIGTNCVINSSSMIKASTIGDNVSVNYHTIITGTKVGNNAHVGPFAHIQEGTVIGDKSHIGNFVEVKNTVIGENSKAKHLSYLGNAEIGNNVNIGAGAITCNFDGHQKHTTVIKDYAFIGTNNSLVAPVTINEKAITAAGSVITEDVPADSLAIGRARQINKVGYASKIRTKQKTFSFMGAVKTTNEAPQEA